MTDPSQPEANPESMLDPDFLAILRCPLTHKPLVLVGDHLCCYESRKAYPIEGGLPVLLIDEASDIPEDQLPAEFRGRPALTAPEGDDAAP